MTDLVVGLAKSVVEGALTKAQSAIKEDARLRQSAQRDLVFIAGEFQMMQSFLDVADEERVTNIVVRTWVRQIRDLAYDVEDCIEFVVHLDTKSRWWRRLIPSCMAAAAEPLDEAIAEIEQIKARVEDVSSRNTRYNLISDSGSKPTVQQQSTPRAAVGETAFNKLIEAAKITKRKQGDLTTLIIEQGVDLQVISVLGTGGDLGTISIIGKAYDDPQVRRNFTCRAWVKLMHPFNPHEFIRCCTAQFYANNCKEHEEAIIGSADVLTMMEATQGYQMEFVRQIKNKRCLIVLEDLSTMAEWYAIRTFLPGRGNGSRIIVSTQQFEIASLCVGHSYQVSQLMQFSHQHSVYAFLKEESQTNEDHEASTCNNEMYVDHEVRYNNILKSKRIEAYVWMKNFTLVGRESIRHELDQYITNAHLNPSQVRVQVMSVCGLIGVGKSALVRQLYCARICKSPACRYGWVDVSQPFNLRDFSRSLLLDFCSESLQAKETAHSDDVKGINPVQGCRDLLERDCLVVIDNLKSTEEWDLIKAALVSNESNCVIIVITTEASIAAYCADKEELVFNVTGIGLDAGFDLFKQEVRRRNRWSYLNDPEHDAKLRGLVSKCGGFPQVIVAIADLLVEKSITSRDDYVRSTNERFVQTLESSPQYDSLRGLFGWMSSKFRTCSYSLKPCMIYMSLFPLYHSIRRRRLVMRWVSEGYSKDNEDKSAEQNGEKFFSQLHGLSIIDRPPQSVTTALGDTKMVLCHVNGFIREYIVSWRMEEDLVFELDGCCDLTTQRIGRHLVIRANWDRDKIVFENIDCSKLRSMTVFGMWKPFFVSESMKLLRVLDLEDASGVKNTDLEQMLKLLRRLKFLSLRRCHEISHLPSSLGDLRQLQTLDIRHTSILNLPANITKLVKLQYLRAGTSITAEPSAPCLSVYRLSDLCTRRHLVGVRVPGGISRLTVLHTLGVVNIDASGGKAILKELENLTQLRKLGVSGINRKNSKKFSSAISCHNHLESLSLQLDRDNQGCLDGISLPLNSLQSLKLYGPVDKLPNLQIDQLRKLTKVGLEMNMLTEDQINLLGKLPKLLILRICVNPRENGKLNLCFIHESCGIEVSSYRKVKVLEIAACSSLHVTFGSHTMQNLELLKTNLRSGSQVELSGLGNLTELKEVRFEGSCDPTLVQDVQSQLDNHVRKPCLKLE